MKTVLTITELRHEKNKIEASISNMLLKFAIDNSLDSIDLKLDVTTMRTITSAQDSIIDIQCNIIVGV